MTRRATGTRERAGSPTATMAVTTMTGEDKNTMGMHLESLTTRGA